MAVVVSEAFILSGRTPRGAWTRRQLELLGAGWPPERGWKGRVIGTSIPDRDAEQFLAIAAGKQAELAATRRGAFAPDDAGPAPDGELLYADGGLAGPNPSRAGGTLAYRLVGPDGVVRLEKHSSFRPHVFGLEVVTNNVAELVAAVRALEEMPAGWSGTLVTDSEVTARRVCRPAVGFIGADGRRCLPSKKGVPFANTPQRLIECVRSLQASRHYDVLLIAGHPTQADLARGFKNKPDGRFPCSPHNVWCDERCGDEAKRLLDLLGKRP